MFDVLKGVAVRDRVAQEEDVCVGVTEGSQSAVVVLARRVPDLEGQGPIVDVNFSAVAIQDGWHVLLGELVVYVTD